MKKYLILIVCSCLLLLTGVVFVACSSDDDGDQQPQVYNVTVEAVLSSDAVTRALSVDGSGNIGTVWAQGEVVYVTKSGESSILGTLAPQSTSTAAAKLIGTLSGATLAVDDELVLTYLKSAANYSGQKGTLSDIGANHAIATATVKVTQINGSYIKTEDATFTSQQAIVKFTMKGETNVALNVSSLSIKYGSTTLSLTDIPDATYTTNGAGVLYVAVPAFDSQLLTLTATVGGNTYKYEKPAVSFENGKYYPVSVRMGMYESYTAKDHYLTMQALNNGTTITFDNKAAGAVEYCVNNGGWETLAAAGASGTTTSLSAGDKVYLRGTNATYENAGGTDSNISCSGPCYVYGNFMSLVYGDSFASAEAKLTGSYTFSNLFDDNDNIRNHPYKDMVLPATSLTDFCYYGMFRKCDGLGRSPIMAKVSVNPDRFAEKCYAEMFHSCSGLYYVTCYSTITSAEYYESWLYGVQPFGIFVTNETAWEGYKNSDSGVPANWTITSR